MSAPPSTGLWARLARRLSPISARPLPLVVTVLVRAFAFAFVVIWMLGGAPLWLALVGCVLGALTWRPASSDEPRVASAPPASTPLSNISGDRPHAPPAPSIAPIDGAREALQQSLKQHKQHKQHKQLPRGSSSVRTVERPAEPLVLQLPDTFSFEYSDAEGVITHRTVIVRSAGISAGRRRYLSGTCTQAHAQRTFRLDRISGWLERTSDGELFEPQVVYKAAGPPEAVETNPANFRSAPASEPSRPWQTAVVFAGFSASKREELEALAEAAGWQVRTGITNTVNYLVAGPMVGPRQQETAEDFGVAVISEIEFRAQV